MKKAFTLVEILVVVIIVGLIAAFAVPNLKSMHNQGLISQAKGNLRSIQVAIDSYYVNHSNILPSALSDLTTAIPTILATVPTDPFSGSAYVYSVSSNGDYYVVYSPGASGGGSATVSDSGVITETSDENCIYISNAGEDPRP